MFFCLKPWGEIRVRLEMKDLSCVTWATCTVYCALHITGCVPAPERVPGSGPGSWWEPPTTNTDLWAVPCGADIYIINCEWQCDDRLRNSRMFWWVSDSDTHKKFINIETKSSVSISWLILEIPLINRVKVCFRKLFAPLSSDQVWVWHWWGWGPWSPCWGWPSPGPRGSTAPSWGPPLRSGRTTPSTATTSRWAQTGDELSFIISTILGWNFM